MDKCKVVSILTLCQKAHKHTACPKIFNYFLNHATFKERCCLAEAHLHLSFTTNELFPQYFPVFTVLCESAVAHLNQTCPAFLVFRAMKHNEARWSNVKRRFISNNAGILKGNAFEIWNIVCEHTAVSPNQLRRHRCRFSGFASWRRFTLQENQMAHMNTWTQWNKPLT